MLAFRGSLAGFGEALRAPKWLWVGALMGAFIVLTITIAAPRIGIVAVTALLIAGQLGTAVAIDRYGLFGVDRIGLAWPRVAGIALLVLRRGADSEAVNARAWTALWTVYIVWGSTYLGIKVAGETIPSFFAVSTRFLLAGAAMAAWVWWRRGAVAFRVTRRELASAALIGLLLPGANALLFVAEHDVPTGLASLIIASVPLIVVCLRLAGGDRPPRAAIVGVVVGFAGIALLLHPEGGATWWADCALSAGRRSRGRSAPTSPRGCRCRVTSSPRRPTRCSRGA